MVRDESAKTAKIMHLKNLTLYGIWMLLNYQPHCLFCQSYKLALTMSTDILTDSLLNTACICVHRVRTIKQCHPYSLV